MTRSVTALAALLLALAVSSCGWLDKKADPKKEWTAEQFYKAAKEELDSRNWGEAAKLYEQLESKFPYGRFAQQAQIEAAYAYYKLGETAQTVSATEKFMKLHPNHPNVDYALYLKALANFKEAGLTAYIDARLGDAHQIVPALPGPFDFVFSDADKDWYKNYLVAVWPKLVPGGCFTAHNVSARFFGGGGAREFLLHLKTLPDAETTIDTSSSEGISISYKRGQPR